MGGGGGEIFEEIFSKAQDCQGKGGNLFIPPIPRWITKWISWLFPWFTMEDSPTHGFSEPIQLNIFIDGLQTHSK